MKEKWIQNQFLLQTVIFASWEYNFGDIAKIYIYLKGKVA
jgi:hypothetical protein